MAIDYIFNLKCAEDLCDRFERHILSLFLREGDSEEKPIPYFVWLRPYREYFEPVKVCVKLCRILKPQSFGDRRILFFEAVASLEHIRDTKNIKDFKRNLDIVRLCFRLVSDEVSAICSAFGEEEKERMNEALHDYLHDCHYSSVAMSVSAVESRLLKLMCLASPELERELEKKTLGQLIYEYTNNKDRYKNVVPEEHEPLLQLCNTYRTFSVHPKKRKITGRLAGSILDLAIEFLTDQDTKPEVVEAQLIASGEDKQS